MFFQKSACSQSLSPNPFPRERGYITGATAPDQARMLAVSHTKPLHDAVAQMADDLYGGYAPKQGRFGCLPKVLHDAKPTKQATLDTPFLYNQEVYRQSEATAGAVAFVYSSVFVNLNDFISNCVPGRNTNAMLFLPVMCSMSNVTGVYSSAWGNSSRRVVWLPFSSFTLS